MQLDFKETSRYSPEPDPAYRWSCERRWDDGPLLCWIGLNPSKGDTTHRPRPTLSKVMDLAENLGMGGVVVVNLFAYRATDPRDLISAAHYRDIMGGENDALPGPKTTLAAWGARGRLQGRGAQVAAMVPDMVCLGVTQLGEPRHPLYVRSGEALRPYHRVFLEADRIASARCRAPLLRRRRSALADEIWRLETLCSSPKRRRFRCPRCSISLGPHAGSHNSAPA
ncbi:MAG: DUF1643 domain-containing protein [Methylocystis sp.]